MNRKGLSEVIAIVLIILVGIAAVGIVAFYVLDIAKRTSLSPVLDCVDLQSNQAFRIASACYTGGEAKVKVFRSSYGFEVDSLNFFISEDNSKWVAGADCKECSIQLEGTSKTYYFALEKEPGDVQLFYKNCLLDTKSFSRC